MDKRSSTAQLFRKKPVEVEAVLWDGENWDEIREFVGEAFGRVTVMQGGVKSFNLRTLEGRMAATRGDWIVKGVKGEVYPVKPDIFEQTYEAV